MDSMGRRKFVLGSGTIVVAGSIAGCLPNDDDVDDEPDDVDDEPDDNDIEEHMSDANGYDGIEDYTGETELTIEVGDPEGGSNYMFQPAAPEIDEGTTVTWEWIDDAAHSVTHVNGDDFDSDIQSDFTFEHTFEESGTYLYHCIPHQAIGHIGALVVV